MKMTRIKSALLGSGAAVALLAASVPASADQIDELRSQIQSLQDKMSQLESSQVSKRRVAPAAAVESGSKPRSWKLPGTNTSMQIGGYAKLDIIYDINGTTSAFAASDNPPADGSAAGNRQGNFSLHARQSRFWIRTWTPTDWGELETHIQGDFFAGNTFRMRHAYGRLGPVLAGQTWSNFVILHSLSDTLDFAGPVVPGSGVIRTPQLAYTHSFGGGTSLLLAIENPATATVVATAGAPVVTGPNSLPEFIVRLNHRSARTAFSIVGLFRQLEVNNSAATNDTAFGWGIHAGIGHTFGNKKTKLGLAGWYGKGIGRHVGNTDAVLNGAVGPTATLRTVTNWGIAAWVQHRWTDTIRSSLVYGRSFSGIKNAATGGKGALGAQRQDSWSVIANLIWSPVPRVDIGVEYNYKFAGFINSANGKQHRIQVAFKYSF